MPTDTFDMEPQSTREGLLSAGAERVGAMASGLPVDPGGIDTAAWARTVETALAAHHRTLAAKTTSSAVDV